MKTPQEIETRIKNFIDEVEGGELYAVVSAKSDIAVLIHDQMEARGVSCAELARRLGKSRAYISKMLGGGTNMTIETLVGIARVLDCHFSDFIPRPKSEKSAALPVVKEMAPTNFPHYAGRPVLQLVDDKWLQFAPQPAKKIAPAIENVTPCDERMLIGA